MCLLKINLPLYRFMGLDVHCWPPTMHAMSVKQPYIYNINKVFTININYN